MRAFRLVDVFGSGEFTGNPLAVIADGSGLSTEQMLAITRWLNLSETTFLLPPDDPAADYRVRIFTLDRELPFAGHPTLGTCHAWLAAGGAPKNPARIIQECGAGLVPIRRDGGRLAFAAPPRIRSGPVAEEKLEELARYLGIARAAIMDAEWLDNGPGWIGVMLASAEDVLALEPARAWDGAIEVGVVGAHAPGGAAAFEIRAFFSGQHGSVLEDPVTGSLNASMAQWLFARGDAERHYVAAQGGRLGRAGRVFVEQDRDTIWIGGATDTLFEGKTAF